MAKKSVQWSASKKGTPKATRTQPAQKLFVSKINRHANGTRKDVVR